MEKGRNTQNVIIVLLAVAILTMSVGFAAFASELNINGQVAVSSSSWNIAFDSNSYAESSGSVAATTKTINGTSMSYNVNLTEPGDFYEFTINVKNTGTFDAKLTAITLNTLTDAQKKYLSYTLTYEGNEYLTTTTGLAFALAKTTGEKPVKVRVEYIQPENPADLPQDTVNVTLTASLTYDQAQ